MLNVSLDAIEQAARVIDPAFLDTPEIELWPGLTLKLETLNPVRSFKGRGGDWLAARCGAGETLVCASAGNLGQGLAHGARRHGLELHVLAARTANPAELRRLGELGARLTPVEGDADEAAARAAALAAERGWRLVGAGAEPALAEGAATIAVELARRHGPALRTVVVPVGNGSLACGVGTWLRAVSPGTRLVGVGSTASRATHDAWCTGVAEPGPPFHTAAPGLGVRVPEPDAVARLRQVVDEFVLVEEDQLLDAAKLLWNNRGVLTEPSGAAAAAAVIQRPDLAGEGVTALVLTGANASGDVLLRTLHGDPP
ncbi:PLP-dependent lyase/thiolase [Streptomyces johnsoniae]|uniref:PLP-dependent lyase/thiolase n=1 Tax=Streptomyces johnsoniae TaxID=3075532 RepID=A0ABU2S7N5_9ACTN|nr:PLP-dependent lyase/thiolase [Streptomyces sp. DSM 41886]MDT0444987.1 PLP-dependent lyase/thiolase [Streptomyces sp. DSM 41886]